MAGSAHVNTFDVEDTCLPRPFVPRRSFPSVSLRSLNTGTSPCKSLTVHYLTDIPEFEIRQ
ncbi:hypothetical protein E2C01_025290 [Portunus trituberculatus]|uniref:Uncharacterized protein n=1 Tax=Portunus trituberculatus TaxID=210409 RepID=A0A5B7EER9_PORTR|nr:hypothetical protein [Portunus trituberculatus]